MSSSMQLNVSDEQMKELVAKAIFELTTEEKRDELVARAIRSLLTETTGSGYHKKSYLEDMFKQSVRRVVEECVDDHVRKNDQFRAKVADLIQKAFAKAMDENSEEYANLSSKVSETFGKWLAGEVSRY